MKEFLLILGMMIVTFGVRYPVLAIVGKIQLPDAVIRALKYVPPAVLTAIIVPMVVLQDNQLAINFDNAFLVGAIAAVFISWRTKNLLLTIVLGMGVFLGWKLITGGFG